MTPAESILKGIRDSIDKIEPMPDVAVLKAWERGYRSGLKIAEGIARSAHKNALALAGDRAGLAEAERLYPDPSRMAAAARIADLADSAYDEWTSAEVSFERG